MKLIVSIVLIFMALMWGINQFHASQEQQKYANTESPLAHRLLLLKQFRMLQAFESTAPVQHQQLLKLSENSISDSDFKRLVSSTIQHMLRPVIPSQLSSSQLILWSEIYQQQLRDAKRQHSCSVFLSQEMQDISQTQAMLSESTQQKTLNILKNILRQPVSNLPFNTSEAETEWKTVTSLLAAETGNNDSPLNTQNADEHCNNTIRLLELMLSCPSESGKIAVLTYFFRQHPSVVIF